MKAEEPILDSDYVTFENVWDSLDAPPEEIAELKLKSQIMNALEDKLESMDGTHAEKAEAAGVSAQRLEDLLNSEITLFKLDTLLAMAYALGLEIQVTEQAA